MKFIKLSLAVAFLGLSLTTQAQSYPQKKAAIEEKVYLNLGLFIPEFEKATAVSEIYSMIFQSGAGQYFNKDEGLIQTINIQQLYGAETTAEELERFTRLKGNVLNYPTQHNAVSLIVNRLNEERNILTQIPTLVNQLKNMVPNMEIKFERDTLDRAPNSNVSRLEFVTLLKKIFNENPALVDAIKSYKKFYVTDSVDDILSNTLEISSRETRNGNMELFAQLSVGREGVYTEQLFTNEAVLGAMLKIGFLRGFGTQAGYFMKSSEFSEALQELDAYLTESGKGPHLQANGVKGFELEEEYTRRERLFNNGILTVGTKVEDIAAVVELFFP